MNCIGMLEYKSISAGIKSADSVVKAANVKLLYSMPVCAGKYIIMIRGNVGDVNSAIEAGKSVEPFNLIDTIVIPNLHPDVFSAMNASTEINDINALGVVESFSIAAAIMGADAALKTADIRMIEIRIAKGLGGKAFFTFTGEIGAVKESEKVSSEYLSENGWLVHSCVLSGPHKDLVEKLY